MAVRPKLRPGDRHFTRFLTSVWLLLYAFIQRYLFFSCFIESLRIFFAVFLSLAVCQKYIDLYFRGAFCCCGWRGHF